MILDTINVYLRFCFRDLFFLRRVVRRLRRPPTGAGAGTLAFPVDADVVFIATLFTLLFFFPPNNPASPSNKPILYSIQEVEKYGSYECTKKAYTS